MKDWVDRLVDVPCILIGAGPSINNHINDEKLKKKLGQYFTIGINRAFLFIDPTILFWQDLTLWKDEYKTIHNMQAIKVARDIADPRRIYHNFYLKGSQFKFDTSKTHVLYGRGATAPLVVQLACSLGARPIICLGMDCKKGEPTKKFPDGPSNFYGDNEHHFVHTLKNCNTGLETIAKYCPVEIINCSENDILGSMRDINEVLTEIDADGQYAKGRQAYVKQLLRLPS